MAAEPYFIQLRNTNIMFYEGCVPTNIVPSSLFTPINISFWFILPDSNRSPGDSVMNSSSITGTQGVTERKQESICVIRHDGWFSAALKLGKPLHKEISFDIVFTRLRTNSTQIDTSRQCMLKRIHVTTEWHVSNHFMVITISYAFVSNFVTLCFCWLVSTIKGHYALLLTS